MATTTYATAADVRGWIRVDDAVDDEQLDLVIDAVSRQVDRFCGWQFYQDDAVSARTYCTPYKDVTYLPDPISTVTGLVVKTDPGADGTYETTWTISTDFSLEPANGTWSGHAGFPQWVIRAVGSKRFTPSPEQTLEVTAKWGWAAVPDPVKLATIIQTSKLHARRNAREGVLGFEGAGTVTAPKGLDGDVMNLLSPYARPSRLT